MLPLRHCIFAGVSAEACRKRANRVQPGVRSEVRGHIPCNLRWIRRGIGTPAMDMKATPQAAGDPAPFANESAFDAEFARALAVETAVSERLRMRVLAATLAVLLAADQLVFIFAPAVLQQFAQLQLPVWLPLRVIGPFLAYECVALIVIERRLSRGKGMPAFARTANAIIETSLPTYIMWWINAYAGPEITFSAWPSNLYYLFIAASTLRLNFLLPAFTGLIAAGEYVALALLLLPVSFAADEPVLSATYHLSKGGLMLATGLVAGLVAARLRTKFHHAVTAMAQREQVTNLFGQHVSPSVVERILSRPAELGGEMRSVCVMFVDIRNFTQESRQHAPTAVVAYLNDVFAAMIEVIERHEGVINKFLGDGFLAVFGAPIDDPAAVDHAVAAAREILRQIDRRKPAEDLWPLKIGIAIHAGPALTGIVGSPRRKEFTVIGDTVNLAARLEALNKQFGSRLLVSDEVAAALGPSLGAARAHDNVEIRGYSRPVRVWQLS